MLLSQVSQIWWVWSKVTADLFLFHCTLPYDMMQCCLYECGSVKDNSLREKRFALSTAQRIPLRGNPITVVQTKCRLKISSLSLSSSLSAQEQDCWAEEELIPDGQPLKITGYPAAQRGEKRGERYGRRSNGVKDSLCDGNSSKRHFRVLQLFVFIMQSLNREWCS